MNSDCLTLDAPELDRTTITKQNSSLVCTAYGPNARPDGFAVLQEEWNELVHRSRFNSIFLTHEWQTTWWDSLGQGELWILAFRCAQSNRTVGIAPLFLHEIANGANAGKRQFQRRFGCIEVSDYLDPDHRARLEKPVYAAQHQVAALAPAPTGHRRSATCRRIALTYQELFDNGGAGWLSRRRLTEDTASSCCPCVTTLPQRDPGIRQETAPRDSPPNGGAERESTVGFSSSGSALARSRSWTTSWRCNAQPRRQSRFL